MLIFVFKQRLKKYVSIDFCLNSDCIFKIIIKKDGNFARNVDMPLYLHTPVWPIIFYRNKHTFELVN